ncbi:protein STICHEL [Tanacetum coccineum]|uniref:Protein STICHEL n=1 Tax=Tanacetum coccineum TaxID=301880 RepID=A0ABQ5AP64_9ASTR
MLCGSQSSNHRRHSGSAVGAYKKKKRHIHKMSQGLVPLLTNDGRNGQTSYKSQEGLELVAINGEIDGGSPSSLDNINCYSYKFKPMFFEDIVGQNVVVQSLVNSIIKGRIAPIYLFQGPRGTGKTSTARIFAAAMNSHATETGPVEFAGNALSIFRARIGPTSNFIRHEVYVIDECHLLPSKLWLAFQKFLEEPPPSVVFIFITTDLANVPRAVLSRCQKYLFNKIKDSDIVDRLRKISEEENLDVDSDALDLIALNVEGSLRDAETSGSVESIRKESPQISE